MFYQKITHWCLYLAVLLVPIFFLPWTLDPLEINKQTLLIVLVLLACLSLGLNVFKQGAFSWKKSPTTFLLLIFLLLLGVSAFLSKSHFLSWVGTSAQEYTSFISFLTLASLFWLIGSQANDQKIFSKIILFFLSGASVAGLIGIFSVFKIFLPFSFAQTQAFNTVGTLNSLGIFLAIATVLANGLFLVWKGKGKTTPLLVFIISLITFVFLFLINYSVSWIILSIGLLVLLLQVFLRAHALHHTKKYLLPMLLCAGSLFFLFVPLPKIISVPTEVSLNFSTSQKIIQQTMTGKEFWFGTGPGTYLFNYTKFRPLEVNQTAFWNTRFDRSASDFLTVLPTLGLLPILFFFLFSLTVGFLALKEFFKKEAKQWLAFVLIPAWFALVLSFFLYSSNFTLNFLFIIISGLIYSLNNYPAKKFSLIKSPKIKIISSIIFTFLALILITTFFLVTERFVAEFAFTKAVRLDRADGNLQEIVTLVDKAASTNRFNDSYYRNLAATLLLQVQKEMADLGTNQPNENQNKYLQALIATSINSAKTATQLEPYNVTNWLELGLVYRTFIPLTNEAGQFAISSFETAITLEPNNPSNYLELGKTYLAVAASLEQLTISTDNTQKLTAQKNRAEAFVTAEKNFNKALELKADYAPTHYQLALAYEQQGRLNEAIGKMESINKYNPQDVGVAFELGLLYLRRLDEGDLSRAETALKQTITLLPSYSNAHWYLAFVYEKAGNIPAAIYEIEAVEKLNPDNEMVKNRLERLKAGQTTTETETLEDTSP